MSSYTLMRLMCPRAQLCLHLRQYQPCVNGRRPLLHVPGRKSPAWGETDAGHGLGAPVGLRRRIGPCEVVQGLPSYAAALSACLLWQEGVPKIKTKESEQHMSTGMLAVARKGPLL